MNEYDTELIKAILVKENYAFVPTENEADIVMLNTCAIRENAHRKVYGRIHDIRHRREGRPVMIGLLGCMATNLRKDLLEDRKLKIDLIAGPDSYKRLPELIREATLTGERSYDVTLSEFETYSDITPLRKEGVNAWLAVMRGCNNFCTFCVVPYTRGRERSRAPENIVEEVRRLAGEGFKQVTLLGQNVNSYRYEEADFADLIDQVSRVEGIERIRFTSPHPKDFPEKLLKVVAENPKACKHIHLPMQSGNDRVLDMMNRTYTQKEYLELVDKIRTLSPHIALTTDIIVGFPTETDTEFEDTFKVAEAVRFDSAFTFKYSERKGTVASQKFPDDVAEKVKTERIMRLIDLQKRVSLEKNREHIGQVQEIMIESLSTTRSDEEIQGRTDGNKLVIIPLNCHPRAGGDPVLDSRFRGWNDKEKPKLGDFLNVRITGATPNVLKGVPMGTIPASSKN